MAKLTLVGAAVILFASATIAAAGQKTGASTDALIEKGGPGASSEAPGKKMKQHRSVTKGTSKNAPGQEMKKPRY